MELVTSDEMQKLNPEFTFHDFVSFMKGNGVDVLFSFDYKADALRIKMFKENATVSKAIDLVRFDYYTLMLASSHEINQMCKQLNEFIKDHKKETDNV